MVKFRVGDRIVVDYMFRFWVGIGFRIMDRNNMIRIIVTWVIESWIIDRGIVTAFCYAVSCCLHVNSRTRRYCHGHVNKLLLSTCLFSV